MKRDYESISDNIIGELLESIFADLKNTNTEIRNKEDHLAKLSKEMQLVISLLDDKQKKAVDNYMHEKNSLNYKYYVAIYIQGLKDCIKLLKFIEIV